jgi:UPF0755 protein
MGIKKRKWWLVAIGIIGVLVIGMGAAGLWYIVQLKPVDNSNTERVAVVIESGSSPSEIAHMLKEKKLVRNAFAFLVYARVNGAALNFQAGLHRISQSQSVPEVVETLQNADTEEKVVQFVPGAMLRDNSSTSTEKKQDIRTTLERLGYQQEEIERAFVADYSDYNDTLFKDRPAGAGIEGYVWGETYYVAADATVEQILRRTFDEYVKQIKENNLEAAFEKQGLTLYEGITLASIIQKEVSCHGKQVCDDQKQVAQVFLKRLNEGISLGSDVTFIYAAAQDGKTPTVDYDSLYNTRIHQGLPPGPISTPGLGALLAVAEPAEGDYLFFVSGDDGTMYYTRTDEEHNEITRKYCQVNCLLPQ